MPLSPFCGSAFAVSPARYCLGVIYSKSERGCEHAQLTGRFLRQSCNVRAPILQDLNFGPERERLPRALDQQDSFLRRNNEFASELLPARQFDLVRGSNELLVNQFRRAASARANQILSGVRITNLPANYFPRVFWI